MHLNQPNHLRKQALAVAMTAALGAAGFTGAASADQITFSLDANKNAFTMLNAKGQVTFNSDVSHCYPNMQLSTNQCSRTAVGGTITYDTATHSGSMTIVPFSFFNSGFASSTAITFQAIGNGDGDPASGNLLLGNMGFNWNLNYGIPVSIVWDGTGFFNAITAGLHTGDTITGTGTNGAIPESDNTAGTSLTVGTLGKAILATITTNTSTIGTPVLGTNPSGTLPLVNDTVTDVTNGDLGIGGSPMPTPPFQGYNANFDFTSLTVTAFTDTTPPVLTLTGAASQNVTLNGTYTEQGATCDDAHDGSRTVTIGGQTVDTSVAGDYTLTYDCADASANAATQVTRTVHVVSSQTPSITLLGTTPVTHECHTTYTDAGATASDPQDGNITGSIVTNNGVNANVVGSYTVTYDVTDSNSNAAPTTTRDVNVVDTTNPVVSISGPNPLTLQSTEAGTFVAPSATAADTCDGALTVGAPTGTVNFTVPFGNDSVSSALLYSATDTHTRTGTATLNINVERAEPVITRVGNTSISIASGAVFTDPGITVHDVQEGDAAYNGAGTKTSGAFPGSVVISSLGGGGNLNGTQPANGNYTITYDVTDTDGNVATQVTRSLVVGVAFTANDSNFTMINPGGFFVDGASDIQATWNGATYDPTTLPGMNPGAPDIPAADMALATVTPTPFFSYYWIAHDVHVVTDGTYNIETCPAPINNQGIASDGSTHCLYPDGSPKPTIMHVVVPPGQLGAHMLFDWGAENATTGCGKANCNIDVFVVWAQNASFPGSPNGTSTNLCAKGEVWELASIDPDGDGIPGVQMLDGAFEHFNANFNLSNIPPCTPSGQEIVVQNSGDTTLGGGSADLWTLSGLLTWLLAGLRRKKS